MFASHHHSKHDNIISNMALFLINVNISEATSPSEAEAFIKPRILSVRSSVSPLSINVGR